MTNNKKDLTNIPAVELSAKSICRASRSLSGDGLCAKCIYGFKTADSNGNIYYHCRAKENEHFDKAT